MSALLVDAATFRWCEAVRPVDAARHGAVLIVEGNRSVSDRMRDILAAVAPAACVAMAFTRAQAFEMLAGRAFTLMFVGLSEPACDGLSLILHVQQTCPHIETVAMSETDDDDLVSSAISAGAIGYLLTGADDAAIAFLLRSIERGGAPMDSRIARRMLGSIAASARSKPGIDQTSPAGAKPRAEAPLLSPRELKVLRFIAQGWTNREIAEAVYLSVNTIEFHAKNIYRKLSVKSRTQAVHQATRLGLLN
ncbi:response regulator transcription factor [Variovorax sp. OV700]|uniref:response regulator transcription factor n=1 Tax=Variovorax sp. OV700 TaxID=1882826 RepID=UPI0008899A2E|nr:response regulator transcription factor [Variovorax sp. OV700]SDI23262.1 DNA-binding response regulator, NarL/FixJ family, contains REC and HTH domains [Variovorax sp. OV700]